MARKGLSRELALRIGLAARALPGIEAKQLLDVLTEVLQMPLTRSKLESLNLEQLKCAGMLAGAEQESLARAMQFLLGEEGVSPLFAQPSAYSEGDMPGSIRVAVASNGGDAFNGHFASCQGFLIYQLSGSELRLIDVRLTDGAADADDKTAWLVKLIADCHVLYVVSVGGPAAAKIIKAGIHPIKDANGGIAGETLLRLQQVLAGTPPPWLAKILGVSPEQRVRFSMEEEA
ncbi:MAG: dinitrogenase iron-molybdenum cofactor biosynthesis protein [Zetaproteobacteria bacterium CG12_big_fil_rev_8_21_14_0_65_54_13]|nr:MAG: dinitrogenase iron-molybdenum cofactor biosynthesis protein [Zetaproteobacteria bacterium CG23_combo_of_CG06-09_8_20_14_all_54_7]PIW48721.1 MAG: dinitrogenase iron-molybdenum cofactor biosynthesis protein [Zetaproteobacteria bacterium CG12_big_fil_rev_8_21_14_0_65_54_13]PIX54683.1 MAG: dinitrogenase iron-molybdenum cofactor biosynthesis protein [Zetaproteobacteria bacterium CG_4_10_14_3_um_filter_54_28]